MPVSAQPQQPSEARPRKKLSLRKRLALCAVATLLALLGAEVTLRIWGALTKGTTAGEFLQYDERIGWANRPGFSGRHKTVNFDVAVHFDQRGHRVAAPSTTSPSLDDAVLMIGDSTTFGWGVEEPETVAAHLRTALEHSVCNLGVSGIGSDQQLILLREALAAAKPRAAIVTFTPNDVFEVTQQRPYRRYKPWFVDKGNQLELFGSPPPQSLWFEHCHLWRWLMKVTDDRQQTLDVEQSDAGRYLVQLLYKQMQTECEANDCKFLLVSHHASWLQKWAAENGLPHVDVTDVFERLEKLGPTRFEHDGHWLPHVHKAIADALLAKVPTLGLERR